MIIDSWVKIFRFLYKCRKGALLSNTQTTQNVPACFSSKLKVGSSDSISVSVVFLSVLSPSLYCAYRFLLFALGFLFDKTVKKKKKKRTPPLTKRQIKCWHRRCEDVEYICTCFWIQSYFNKTLCFIKQRCSFFHPSEPPARDPNCHAAVQSSDYLLKITLIFNHGTHIITQMVSC